MQLPRWVQEDIERLPDRFTVQILIEVWEGGVARRDITERRHAAGQQQTKTK